MATQSLITYASHNNTLVFFMGLESIKVETTDGVHAGVCHIWLCNRLTAGIMIRCRISPSCYSPCFTPGSSACCWRCGAFNRFSITLTIHRQDACQQRVAAATPVERFLAVSDIAFILGVEFTSLGDLLEPCRHFQWLGTLDRAHPMLEGHTCVAQVGVLECYHFISLNSRTNIYIPMLNRKLWSHVKLTKEINIAI